MTSLTFWLTLLITIGAIVTTALIGAGFYRVAHGPALSTRHHMAARLVVGLLGGWLLLALVLGISSFFITDPAVRVPRIAYTLIPLVAGWALLTVAPAFRQVADRIPPHWLIVVQVSRVLGGVFLIAYAQGLLPGVFALPAGIGDVLIGLAAPIVALSYRAGHPWSRRFAVLWNIAGLFDLTLAVTLGFLSAPGPFQQLALGMPNTAIVAFPFVLIPAFLVPLMILLHLLSLRELLQMRGTRAIVVGV